MKLTVPLLTDFRRDFPEVLLEVSTPYGVPDSEFDVAVVAATRPWISGSPTCSGRSGRRSCAILIWSRPI